MRLLFCQKEEVCCRSSLVIIFIINIIIKPSSIIGLNLIIIYVFILIIIIINIVITSIIIINITIIINIVIINIMLNNFVANNIINYSNLQGYLFLDKLNHIIKHLVKHLKVFI